MAARAELKTVLTGDDSPFVQAVERAEKRAQTFHSRLTGLFRRDPSARAERALSGFVGGIASGDIQGAVVGLAERFRGLGLAAGVGLGAALIIFQKAKEQLDEVDKAVQKVNADLARPLSFQSALGPEGISKEIETAAKDLDDLKEKRKGFFQSIGEAAIRGQPEPSGDPYLTDYSSPNRVPKAAQAQEDAEKRLKQLALARANAELRTAQIKQTAENTSEREAVLLKTSMDYQKRIAEIQLESGLTKPGRSAEVLFRRITAAKIEHETIVDGAMKRFDITKLQEETEARILALHNTSLTKDQQGIAALRERVALLQQELALENDPIKRAHIQNQIQDTENQEQIARYRESKKPWAQKNAERLAQQDYQNWAKRDAENMGLENVHRDIHGRIIGGTDPITGEHKDVMQPSILDEPKRSPFANDNYSLGSHGKVGDTWNDKTNQGVNALGSPGVLNRIEAKLDGMGANK